MLWALLFLACGEKSDSDSALGTASQEDPNPQFIGGYSPRSSFATTYKSVGKMMLSKNGNYLYVMTIDQT